MALLFAGGYRWWPTILIDGFAAAHSVGQPLLAGVTGGIAQLAEAFIATALLRRLDIPVRGWNLRQICLLMTFGALVPPIFSAILGTQSMLWLGLLASADQWRAVSQAMVEVLPPNGFLARLGVDEFGAQRWALKRVRRSTLQRRCGPARWAYATLRSTASGLARGSICGSLYLWPLCMMSLSRRILPRMLRHWRTAIPEHAPQPTVPMTGESGPHLCHRPRTVERRTSE